MSILDTITIATTAQLRAEHHPREILAAEDAGRIFRVATGIWVSPEIYVDPQLDDALACLSGGVIGYLSAAMKHNLCDAIPPSTYVIVPVNISRPRQRLPIQYIRTRSEDALTIGVDVTDFHGWPIRMTNPARTVVDLYRIEPKGIRQHSAAALTRYIAADLPTGDIADIADRFGTWDVIRPEVEIAKEALKGGFAP